MARKKKQELVIAAVDAGNGGVKSVVWKTSNQKFTKDIFPSSRAEISGDKLGVADEHRFVEYDWGGKLYAIGESVLDANTNIDRHLGLNRYGNELHQFLVAAALARQGIGRGDYADALVNLTLFTPPGMYQKAAPVIVENLTGKTVEMYVDGKSHTWCYEAVQVLPEGLAAAPAMVFGSDGSVKNPKALQGVTMIADGGTLTLDFILLKQGKFMPETLPTATYDSLGVQDVVISPVLRRLRKDDRFQYVTADHLDKVLRDGMKANEFKLHYGGHIVDLTYDIEARFRVLAEQAMNVIDSSYRGLERIERLIIVGGWTDMVFSHIKGTYNDKVERFPGDGIYANALGAMHAIRAELSA